MNTRRIVHLAECDPQRPSVCWAKMTYREAFADGDATLCDDTAYRAGELELHANEQVWVETVQQETPAPARPALTGEDLTSLIDPAIAVDRALTPAERAAFEAFALVGRWQGAQPADWIADGVVDAYASTFEDWWERYGGWYVTYMVERFGLPEPLVRRLLGAALNATAALTSATIDADVTARAGRRTHVEIASGAALWARGYAEALGWTP